MLYVSFEGMTADEMSHDPKEVQDGVSTRPTFKKQDVPLHCYKFSKFWLSPLLLRGLVGFNPNSQVETSEREPSLQEAPMTLSSR